MKVQYLIIFLICGMFAGQGWAPPPGKGGATGGAEVAPDISKCDLNPSKQTKIKVKGKDGKEHFICTGQAICGGKSVPVSCKVSEKEQCPTAKICIVYEEILVDNQILCDKMPEKQCVKDIKASIEFVEKGGDCFNRRKYWKVHNKTAKLVYAQVKSYWNNRGQSEQDGKIRCFKLPSQQYSGGLECPEVESGAGGPTTYYNYYNSPSPNQKDSVIYGYFEGCDTSR